MVKRKGPKILFLDIETSPIIGYAWGLWNNDIALNQLIKDWHILSWSAKWRGKDEIMYMDQRRAKNIEDDSKILKKIWALLDEADVVVTHNGKSFDIKRLNARFIKHDFIPPSGYKQVDTKELAKKKFGFTSNKLEYIAANLNKKFKKQKHEKFNGFELWRACLAGDQRAWDEMEKYNKYDVLVLEELYEKLLPWDGGVNGNLYTDAAETTCHHCGGELLKKGYCYTQTGKFQRYFCSSCGLQCRGRFNFFTDQKKRSIRVRAD